MLSSSSRPLVWLCLVAVVALAGCTAPFGGGATPDPTPDPTETETPTATDAPTPDPTPTPYPEVHAGYDETTVTVLDGETGEELGAVEAAIADNSTLRFTGLSETDVLPPDRGMLFVYGSEGERSFVMRNMSFDIDMVFVRADGTIESIYHAPAPGPDENGNNIGHTATAQYVLEVNRDWTTERGIEEGDRVEFDLPE